MDGAVDGFAYADIKRELNLNTGEQYRLWYPLKSHILSYFVMNSS